MQHVLLDTDWLVFIVVGQYLWSAAVAVSVRMSCCPRGL
jgi:hypothetical protein